MMKLEMPKTLGLLKGHIKLFHGVWIEDDKTKDGPVECHRYCHTVKEIGSPIPHEHVNVSRTAGRRG